MEEIDSPPQRKNLEFWMMCFILQLLLSAAAILPVAAQSETGCPTAFLETDTDFHVDLGPMACVFSDAGREMSLPEVLSPENDALFETVPSGLVDFGFSSSRMWTKVHLKNASDITGTWWITHDIPVAKSLNVHLLPAGEAPENARKLLSLTDASKFGDRTIPHRHLVSEISLPPGKEAYLIIDYTSGQATEMPFFAESVTSFFKRSQAENVQIIALTGLLLGMGFISSIYLFGLAGNLAIAYALYVIAGAGELVHMDKYGFQFIWPFWPAFNQLATAIFATSFVALGTNFVDRFTQCEIYHPKLHIVARITMITLFLIAASSPFLVDFVWYKNFALVTMLFSIAVQVTLAGAAVQRRQSGALMLLIGFGALGSGLALGVVGYLTEGLFEQELAGDAIRLGFLVESVAFSAAIAVRVRATRRERDAFLKEQIRLTEERLNLSEALRKAEEDRRTSEQAVVRSQEALKSTAHDIRQPLAALQLALKSGVSKPGELAESIEYLEKIVRDGLDGHTTPLGVGDLDPPSTNAREIFRADIVFKNIKLMFGEELSKSFMNLKVVDSSQELIADPLSLMRIVGNLVANAFQHANPGRIVVGCRRVGKSLRFEVHDDGCGISQKDLDNILERGEKGAQSKGYGLGLSIISKLADEQNLDFEISSIVGRGTVARVLVPIFNSDDPDKLL